MACQPSLMVGDASQRCNRIIPFLLKKNKGGGNALFDCVLIWEGEQQPPQTHSINNIDHLPGLKHWAWRGCAHAQCLRRTRWAQLWFLSLAYTYSGSALKELTQVFNLSHTPPKKNIIFKVHITYSIVINICRTANKHLYRLQIDALKVSASLSYLINPRAVYSCVYAKSIKNTP